ncbi:hypothetical protein ACPV5V_19260 [Vibrio campbellii]|nr:hypothetical protein [Vibrio parahaemolyticus]HCE3037247.1 hypothetical protein [Vibrio parahaemolyticus]HCG7347886.1 hypothetical protein [Vibrio parahaemolyticus]HCG7352120.1 hypothetical protein [Vibrio parahaemolyticus]
MVELDRNFSEYISERYINAFLDNSLNELMYSDPYEFAYLEGVFTKRFFEAISDTTPSLDESYTSRTGYEIDIYYETYTNEEWIRLVYGKSFRAFLSSLMGVERVVRAKDKYPQLRTIVGNKGGMGIHDDHSAPYNGVAFFNLTSGWVKGMGGELVIWEHLGKKKFKKRYEFPPIANSMSVMKFSPNSYHSVNKPNGNWVRSNILMEVDFIS